MFIAILTWLITATPLFADSTGPAFLDEVMRVYREEQALLDLRVAERGELGVLAELTKDALPLEVPGIGRAKVVSIAGELSIRVVHQASGIAFVFLDEDKISPESPQLMRYLARQHINAGHGEVNPLSGRDVVYVWMKDRAVGEAESLPRQRVGTSGWWRDFRLATFEKPEAGDVALGTACGVVYGGLALCVSAMRHFVSPELPIHWDTGLFTAAWCMTQGIFVKSFSNAILRGPTGTQRLRAAGMSLGFNYSMSILSHGLMHTLNLFDPSGLLAQLQVWGAVAVNSYISVDWRAPLILRERVGLSARAIEIPLPNGKKIFMNQAAAERSFVGVFTFPISLIDITGVSKLPIGKMILLGTVPLLRRATAWYADRLGSPEADVYRTRWENWLPLRIWQGVSDFFTTPWTTSPDDCGRFLKIVGQ